MAPAELRAHLGQPVARGTNGTNAMTSAEIKRLPNEKEKTR